MSHKDKHYPKQLERTSWLGQQRPEFLLFKEYKVSLLKLENRAKKSHITISYNICNLLSKFNISSFLICFVF